MRLSSKIQSQLQAHNSMDKSTNNTFRTIKELSMTSKEQQYTNFINHVHYTVICNNIMSNETVDDAVDVHTDTLPT